MRSQQSSLEMNITPAVLGDVVKNSALSLFLSLPLSLSNFSPKSDYPSFSPTLHHSITPPHPLLCPSHAVGWFVHLCGCSVDRDCSIRLEASGKLCSDCQALCGVSNRRQREEVRKEKGSVFSYNYSLWTDTIKNRAQSCPFIYLFVSSLSFNPLLACAIYLFGN